MKLGGPTISVLASLALIGAIAKVSVDVAAVKSMSLRHEADQSVAAQIERLPVEHYAFLTTLGAFAAGAEGVSREDVELALDVYWSRLDTVLAGETHENFADEANIADPPKAFMNLLASLDDEILALEAGDVEAARPLLSAFVENEASMSQFRRDVFRRAEATRADNVARAGAASDTLDNALIGLGAASAVFLGLLGAQARRSRHEAARKAAEAKAANERARALEQRIADFEANARSSTSSVGETVDALAQMATALLDDARATENRCDRAARTSGESAELAHEMRANARDMAASLQEVTEAVRRSAKAAAEGMARAEKSVVAIHALDRAATDIEAFVELIKSISKKTNRLSWNARIEAARAGEAGAGFAIVAREVKGLAEQATEASARLRDQVDVINTAAGGAASALTDIGEVVADLETNASKVSSAIEAHCASATAIAARAEQSAGGASRVRDEIGAVRAVAEAARDRSQTMEQSAALLDRRTDELERTIHSMLETLKAS